MKSATDLFIVIPLLLGYIYIRAYAGILLSRIGKKKGPLRFSSMSFAAEDLHKHGLIRISLGGPEREKVRFLQQAGKAILYLLIIFVIGSLLFEGRPQAKDNQLSVADCRR
jgi:uncharacterized membrane protein YbjE (DUF340 family)